MRRSWAHPRSRGENQAVTRVLLQVLGASPLTRGKPACLATGLGSGGRIPAHAGKTYPPGSAGTQRRAHPRSRGENKKPEHAVKYSAGASPLTRGKLRPEDQRSGGEGRIPAHAGKTSTGQDLALASRAHPRSRGENLAEQGWDVPALGASPLTRGKLSTFILAVWDNGRIPAHAGKTRGPRRLRARTRAHPRSRGENFSRPKVTPRFPGASPLTRGKPSCTTG